MPLTPLGAALLNSSIPWDRPTCALYAAITLAHAIYLTGSDALTIALRGLLGMPDLYAYRHPEVTNVDYYFGSTADANLIVIQGTVGAEQLAYEFVNTDQAIFTYWPGVAVQRGIGVITSNALDDLVNLVRYSPNPRAPLTIIGHSLGAAAAQLVALYFSGLRGVPLRNLIAFAGPSVGPQATISLITALPNTVFVRNSLDVVPFLPPPLVTRPENLTPLGRGFEIFSYARVNPWLTVFNNFTWDVQDISGAPSQPAAAAGVNLLTQGVGRSAILAPFGGENHYARGYARVIRTIVGQQPDGCPLALMDAINQYVAANFGLAPEATPFPPTQMNAQLADYLASANSLIGPPLPTSFVRAPNQPADVSPPPTPTPPSPPSPLSQPVLGTARGPPASLYPAPSGPGIFAFPIPAGGEATPSNPPQFVPFVLPLSNPFPSELLESVTMTIFKGTVQFNSPGWGGWSESVYSDVTTETYASMMQKMTAWLRYRMRLSIGPDNAGCTNPVVPFLVKVEDQLVNRDALVNYCIPQGGTPVAGGILIPPGFVSGTANTNVQNQNLDMQLGSRIKFQSGAAQQVATPMFHGVPFYSLSQGNSATAAQVEFLRQAPPSGTWLGYLSNFVQFMAQTGLGYKNITGAWNGPNNTPGPGAAPMDWWYNPSKEMVELQWKSAQWPGTVFGGTAPAYTYTGTPYSVTSPSLFYPAALANQASSTWPQINSKCRLQIRDWKSFAVLQGRFTAEVVNPYNLTTAPNTYTQNVGPYQFALRIRRQVRQPQDASVPKVSPIAWSYWWPGEGYPGITPGNLLPGSAGPPGYNIGTPTGSVPAPYGSWADFFLAMGQYQFIESKKLGAIKGSERGRQRNRPT
jgi:Lipase (class 3)